MDKDLIRLQRILLLVYPKYADFQLGHLLFFLKKIGNYDIVTFSVDGKPVRSLGGLTIIPDEQLENLHPSSFKLVILPGGDGIEHVAKHVKLHQFMNDARAIQTPIASICGSAAILGYAGLLENTTFTCNPITYKHFNDAFSNATYTNTTMEIGDELITAKGTAFAEFAVEVGKLLHLWKDKQQEQWALDFCVGRM